jgi:hypothetical protein
MLLNAFRELPSTTTAASLGYANVAAVAAASHSVQPVEKLIEDLNKRIDNLAASVRGATTATTTTGNINKDKSKYRQTKKKSFEEYNLNEDYCWTHGLIGHSSKQCFRRQQDHKAEATYFNRMDGSNRNCRDT